jgi:RimJ/RimL family protein N-acetyltransferase
MGELGIDSRRQAGVEPREGEAAYHGPMDASAVPTVSTDRLVLRGWRVTDREPFARMNADPEVVEHLPHALERAESDALLDRLASEWDACGYGLWAVERRTDAAFLGFVGLHAPAFDAPFTPAVEVGWRLSRDAWGHGYATEGGRAALRFGFELLGLHEVVSFTIPANARSRAVMDRLGMRHDPCDDFDHPDLLADERMRRHVLYRIRRPAWEAATEAPAGSQAAGRYLLDTIN